MAVIKANAYGHGAIEVARALEPDVDAFAVAMLEEAIELHPFADDDLGKDMRYQLMEAYMSLAQNEESLDYAAKAKDAASQILKMDINYRDIKKKMEQIRKLDSELKRKG